MKSKSNCIYLSLQLRALYDDGDEQKLLLSPSKVELSRNGGSISLPVSLAWQEDPNDLHIQLKIPKDKDDLNLRPEMWKNGDYIIPFDPWLEELFEDDSDEAPAVIRNYKWSSGQIQDGILVYCLNWCANPDGPVAPTKYLKLLQECWDSPNR